MWLAATCPCTCAIDCSSRTGYRSILVLAPLTNTGAGQPEHRVPPAPQWSSRLSSQKANSIHTDAWHAWILTIPLNFVQKKVLSLIHFPASFTRAILIWGTETWLEAVPRTNRIPCIGDQMPTRLDFLFTPQASRFCLHPFSPDDFRLYPASSLDFISLILYYTLTSFTSRYALTLRPFNIHPLFLMIPL